MAKAKTESTRKLIAAEGELLKATQREQTNLENATAKRIALYDRRQELGMAIEEAENQSIKLKNAENNFMIENGAVIKKHTELQERANQTVEELIQEGNSSYKAQQILARRQMELAEFEKENKTVIETGSRIHEKLNAAEQSLAKLKEEESDISSKLVVTENEVNTAMSNLNRVTKEKTDAVNAARQAVEIERISIEKAAEEKAIAEENEKERNRWTSKIYKEFEASEEEYARLVKLANDGLEDGLAQAEIESNLRDEWNRVLADRNKAGKNETALIEGSAHGGGAKGNNAAQDALGKLERTKGLGITGEDAHKGDIDYKPTGGGSVALDPSSVSAIGTAVERGGNFKQALRAVRDQQKAVRDAKNNIKIDQPKMVKFMKGDMAEPERKAFEEYLKQKYTPGQIDYLREHALKSQLLSKSDAEKQKKAVEEIKDKIKQALEVK